MPKSILVANIYIYVYIKNIKKNPDNLGHFRTARSQSWQFISLGQSNGKKTYIVLMSLDSLGPKSSASSIFIQYIYKSIYLFLSPNSQQVKP